MEAKNEHDMAAQQEAAKNYQPSLDGPVIGHRTPIAAVTEAYAKADPVYVEKTMALPHTYLYYRPVAGDGNCGWRAIGFSYFEKLVEGGNADNVDGEATRLMSMNPLLRTVGGYDYYEDWADEAIGLLRELADCVTDRIKAQALVYKRWTEATTSNSLIYYLRLLVATYIKVNADKFQAFVPNGQDISSYCAQSIELPNREIDHLGITALFECLLKPANFVLEIAYLDRSPGSTANAYRYPEEANNQPVAALGPIICLLYRPDHYDILYRDALPISTSPGPITMQINRASELYSDTPITGTHCGLGAYTRADFDFLASLPSAPSPAMPLPSSPEARDEAYCRPYISADQWSPPFPSRASSLAQPVQAASPYDTVSSPGSDQPLPPMTPSESQPPCEYKIRFSNSHYDQQDDNQPVYECFNVQTNTFKNSVWNRAHFGNPEFHPEQWCPGDDNTDGRAGLRRKRGLKEIKEEP